MRDPSWLTFATKLCKPCKCVSIDYLRKIAQPAGGPALLPIILELEEAARGVGGEDSQAEVDGDQVCHRLHVFLIAAEMMAAQEDHMSNFVGEDSDSLERILERRLTDGDQGPL